MSGFKSWNNSFSSSTSSSGSGGSSGGKWRFIRGGGGGSLAQWNETPTLLFTNKTVQTTSIMIAQKYKSSDVKLKSNINNLSNNQNEHLDKIKN